jgi:AraC-like DNA-binding protein
MRGVPKLVWSLSRRRMGAWMQGPDAVHADTVELVFLERGRMHGFVDGRRTIQRARELKVIPAGVRHSCWTQAEPVVEIIVHLDARALRQHLGRAPLLGSWPEKELGAARVAALCRAAQHDVADESSDRQLTQAALALVERTLGVQSAAITADPRISRVVDTLRDQVAERWNVATMARLAGMSPSHFAHRFRAVTEAAPLAYLLDLRIARAAWLMTSTDASLTEIAHQVGFASSSRLSEAFQRRRGSSPSQWRKQLPRAK